MWELIVWMFFWQINTEHGSGQLLAKYFFTIKGDRAISISTGKMCYYFDLSEIKFCLYVFLKVNYLAYIPK